jgi:4-carboxymuconolactone decarboxylase
MTQMQDMAKTMNPALEHFTPQGFEKLWPTMPKEAMEASMGKTFNPSGLDAKSRLLLTLAGLTAQGAVAEPQIRLTVRHAKEAGATDQEIAETIGMMGLFVGLPAMQKAMGLATEVLKEDK